ncbi:MAG: DNA ligase D [Desulfobacteraceae bacterium]|nr:MAG: DNA ligase D [Desulfobacteraceae bacterium]
MGLKEYRRKRHFDRTTEPKGEAKSSTSGRLYVVQKHAASRLHYDFRLEMDGVLKSWAVPKGPSLNPSDKHLAVHVEDHPIEYGGFEGIIPANEYGGGTVMVWDKGHWEPEGDPQKGYEQGDLKFRLMGEKLKGLWVLVRMTKNSGEEGKNWLLIKKKDEYARTKTRILDEEPLSAASGRSMDEIAGDRDRVWSSLTGSEKAAKDRTIRENIPISDDLSRFAGARRSGYPRAIRPELATLVKDTPNGDAWLHEIKYDGYRILAFKKDTRVRLITRNRKDWTDRFSSVERALQKLPVDDIVTDGEVVVKKADGTTDFQALQNVLKGVDSGKLTYYVFDLLYLKGFDLTRTPLIDRKELLQNLLESASSESLQFSDHFRGKGTTVHRHACRFALEGIVSKRIDAPYRQQRTRDWLKSKCLQRQEFVIAGFSRPSGSRTGFGALLLGYHAPSGELLYAGRVGTGFNEKMLRELTRDLESLRRKTSSLSNPPTGAEAKGVAWVQPERVAEVEFTEWTEDGMLRHPSFKGIREDKEAREVVREMPREKLPGANGNAHGSSPAAGKNSTEKSSVRIAGIRLSNPGRILYPDRGITKAMLAGFYEQAAGWILPHITGRPLTIVRCPQGRQKKCFYQKHLTEQIPDSVKGIPIKEKNEERTYFMIQDLSGLIALVQLGALEFHPWGSRVDRLEHPDVMIFDMDPGPGIENDRLVKGCRLLREQLEGVGLKSFIKTSGGKGFHLVVPLVRRSGWDEVKAFSGAVARNLVREHPRQFIAVMTKNKRNNKIFVDYLRNGRGATSVAPFSTRARPGAPVSTPIGWDELDERLKPDAFTVENLHRRLESSNQDPWSGFFDIRQSITVAMKRNMKVQE